MPLDPDHWVTNYSDALYGYTLARINDSGIAEDIVQETFLSAWKAREQYKGEASEKSWLYSICKNKIIDYYRKKSKNIMQPLDDQSGTAVFFDELGHWTEQAKPGNWEEPGARIESREFYQVFNDCKKKLQEMQQAVFSMKYLEDLDAAEICAILGISSSNYWVIIHRAKLQLRTCLEKNWLKIT
ncbi:MAG: hypothetical protein RLZZ28_1597 [Bacteroidota bacterium]